MEGVMDEHVREAILGDVTPTGNDEEIPENETPNVRNTACLVYVLLVSVTFTLTYQMLIRKHRALQSSALSSITYLIQIMVNKKPNKNGLL